MISNDSSVIINPAEEEEEDKNVDNLDDEEEVPRNCEVKPRRRRRLQQQKGEKEEEGQSRTVEEEEEDESVTNTPSSNSSLTPDSSFITPRPIVVSAAAARNQHKEKGRDKSSSGSQWTRRYYKNSVSTMESDDSEEINNSSSSAASTLSSRNSLVPPPFYNTLPNLRSTPKVRPSPTNGPHGIKFFVNPRSGRVDLKGPESGSLSRRRNTKNLFGGTENATRSAINIVGLPSVIPDYCTLTRPRRKPREVHSVVVDTERPIAKFSRSSSSSEVEPSFSIYSDINDFQELFEIAEEEKASDEEADSSDNEKHQMPEKVNKKGFWENDTEDDDLIESNVEELEDDDSAVDTTDDEDEDDVSVRNPGTVLPTGCHRHPQHASLPPPGIISKTRDDYEEQEDDYLSSLLCDTWNSNDVDTAGRSLMDSTRFIEDQDRFSSLTLPRDLNVASLTHNRRRRNNRRGNLGGRTGSLLSTALSGLNLAGPAKILRRHTTYVKSDPSESADSVPKHVHSWHKNNTPSARKKRQKVKPLNAYVLIPEIVAFRGKN